MPLLFSDGTWNACVVGLTPKDPVEATAFKAMRRQLEALTHVEVPVDGEYPVQIRIGQRWADSLPEPHPALSPTGFRLHVSEDAITLVGGSPKGALNAAYELLERLGLCWPVSSVDLLVSSPPNHISIEPMDFVKEPSFPRITLFQDLRTLRDYSDPGVVEVQARNDRDLSLWMGRQRFTGLFGNLPEAPEPWADARRRGIVRQAGGHLLPRLLPRELFEAHPEYFPMNEEGERFLGNVCASRPEALILLCENARSYVNETAADVLHLWGEDVLGGKWCACPDCRTLSVQDQYLRVVNAVADGLAAEFPNLRVAFIAYHDTLEPKLTGTPRPNVVLLFAPRNRCYRHPLADSGCERNTAIYAGLQEYRRIFGPGRLHTFEYYGDALLWCSAAIVVPRLIVEDLRAYHSMGVTDSGCLMFGGYSWFSHPLNLYTFARASCDTNRTAEEIICEFASCIFPGSEAAMTEYYQHLEDAARLLVERTDWFYRVPNDPSSSAQLYEETEHVEAAWEDLTGSLNQVLATARPKSGLHLMRERQALRFSQHLVRAYRRRMKAVMMTGEPGSDSEREAALQEAETEIRCALRLLHDLSPYLRGSWGAENQGEPRRLRRLLQELRPPAS